MPPVILAIGEKNQEPRRACQNLHLHVFLCVTACLLATLLLRRAARQAGYRGSSRRPLAELAEIRCCRLIEATSRKRRPRVRLEWPRGDCSFRATMEFCRTGQGILPLPAPEAAAPLTGALLTAAPGTWRQILW
jgi:hypothetical protein